MGGSAVPLNTALPTRRSPHSQSAQGYSSEASKGGSAVPPTHLAPHEDLPALSQRQRVHAARRHLQQGAT